MGFSEDLVANGHPPRQNPLFGPSLRRIRVPQEEPMQQWVPLLFNPPVIHPAQHAPSCPNVKQQV
jgi:hypothetical protein